MNKIIPSIIQDNGEYYIHMEEYKKVKELGDHYKHLYSEVKKQKDDVVEFINKRKAEDGWLEVNSNRLLRMLGEIDAED